MSRSNHKSSGDIVGTTVLFKVLYYKIKNVVFICFLYYLCESIINLLQYRNVWLIESVGYLGYLC